MLYLITIKFSGNVFTAALALRSRGLVIGSREMEEERGRRRRGRRRRGRRRRGRRRKTFK